MNLRPRLLSNRLLVAASSTWLTVVASQVLASEIATLTEKVLANESRFIRVVVESSEFRWSSEEAPRLLSSRLRRIVQWHDRFHESACVNDFSAASSPVSFRFVWSDGDRMTVCSPPDSVNHYAGRYRPPPSFQPYATMLELLGFDGSLSRFLTGDNQPLDPLLVELAGEEDFNGWRTLRVIGNRRLSGSALVRTIELRLAVEYGFLPCWGRLIETEGEDRRPKAEARVTSFVPVEDALWLPRETLVKSLDQKENVADSTKVVLLNGSLLTTQPPDRLFQFTEVVGNPVISTYEDGQLRTSKLYRPPPVKKPPSWLPIENWLLINDAILGAVALIYLIKVFRNWMLNPVPDTPVPPNLPPGHVETAA